MNHGTVAMVTMVDKSTRHLARTRMRMSGNLAWASAPLEADLHSELCLPRRTGLLKLPEGG
jgi:hypothetical protein